MAPPLLYSPSPSLPFTVPHGSDSTARLELVDELVLGLGAPPPHLLVVEGGVSAVSQHRVYRRGNRVGHEPALLCCAVNEDVSWVGLGESEGSTRREIGQFRVCEFLGFIPESNGRVDGLLS